MSPANQSHSFVIVVLNHTCRFLSCRGVISSVTGSSFPITSLSLSLPDLPPLMQRLAAPTTYLSLCPPPPHGGTPSPTAARLDNLPHCLSEALPRCHNPEGPPKTSLPPGRPHSIPRWRHPATTIRTPLTLSRTPPGGPPKCLRPVGPLPPLARHATSPIATQMPSPDAATPFDQTRARCHARGLDLGPDQPAFWLHECSRPGGEEWGMWTVSSMHVWLSIWAILFIFSMGNGSIQAPSSILDHWKILCVYDVNI